MAAIGNYQRSVKLFNKEMAVFWEQSGLWTAWVTGFQNGTSQSGQIRVSPNTNRAGGFFTGHQYLDAHHAALYAADL